MVIRQIGPDGNQIPLALSGYRCFSCGEDYPQRVTICPGCHSLHTMTPLRESVATQGAKVARRARRASSIRANQVEKVSTGIEAWDVALDGGFVFPSSLLVKGEAGVGKSTQAILIAAHVAKALGRPVLYGSAEMPDELFAHVARTRLHLDNDALRNVFVTDTDDLEAFMTDVSHIRPCMVIVDSMQRFRIEGEIGIVVLRTVVADILEAQKKQKFIAMLISQVTKGDDFAGENTIRHNVDAEVDLARVPSGVAVQVLYKNRYGRTPLVGVLPLEEGTLPHAHDTVRAPAPTRKRRKPRLPKE